ncbi:MAG: hypothetical protein U0Q19_09920 [Kineosporiaceae bacterium]
MAGQPAADAPGELSDDAAPPPADSPPADLPAADLLAEDSPADDGLLAAGGGGLSTELLAAADDFVGVGFTAVGFGALVGDVVGSGDGVSGGKGTLSETWDGVLPTAFSNVRQAASWLCGQRISPDRLNVTELPGSPLPVARTGTKQLLSPLSIAMAVKAKPFRHNGDRPAQADPPTLKEPAGENECPMTVTRTPGGGTVELSHDTWTHCSGPSEPSDESPPIGSDGSDSTGSPARVGWGASGPLPSGGGSTAPPGSAPPGALPWPPDPWPPAPP